MDQKWSQILVILVFYQKMTSGAGEDLTVKEGQPVDIKCDPVESGTMVVWFRVLDKSGMEFIASFSNTGMKKSATTSPSSTFTHAKINQHFLTLQSFNKARDSGAYSCASLYKGNELKFGKVTRLVGEKVEVATGAPATTAKQHLCASTTACVCNNNNKQGETSLSLFCTPIILGPLAGGCGLLLLLLIITTLYCNKIRTQRCPHHYKRKPRPMMPPGKQMMTNRHV